MLPFPVILAASLAGCSPSSARPLALLAGDAETAERLLQDLVLRSLSVHDTGRGPGEPERVYHAFMLGLLVWLGPRYRVSSNREAGYGRCDLMIAPKVAGQPGVVMEPTRVARADVCPRTAIHARQRRV